MSDPSETDPDIRDTDSPGVADEQCARLVPEAELERLHEQREGYAEIIADLEAENEMLKQQIATLERRIEHHEQQRQQLIENYERIIESKQRHCNCSAEEPVEESTPLGRFRSPGSLFSRFDK